MSRQGEDRVDLEIHKIELGKKPDFSPQKPVFVDENGADDPGVTQIMLDVYGNPTIKTDESAAMLRSNDRDSAVVFFVKARRDNHLYNPLDTMARFDDLTAWDSSMGRRRYEFTQVKKNVFELYVQFLKQRKSHIFNEAQREVLNG